MTIPEFSVTRKITVTMLIGLIVLFGIISFFRLGLDMLPELEYPIVSVITTYSGAASEDVEKLITKPIEEIAATVKNVKKVSSISREGISAVVIEFQWGTNLDFACQDVRDRVSLITDFLPEEADTPQVVKFNIADTPVVVYGVTGLANTYLLREYLDENIKPRLERLEGVASAMVLGGLEREINILVNPAKLQAYNLSIDRVINVLRVSNVNLSGGYATKGYQEYLVRTFGEYKTLSDIANTVVSIAQDGTPIYLKDIAEVKDTYKEIRSYARTNRKDSVLLAILKQSGANTLRVSENVKKAIDSLKSEFDKLGIEFYPVFDMGLPIRRTVQRTAENALFGGILAIIAIYLFLRNWRPTLAIALAIPLSVMTSFIGLYALNYTLNLITLGGLALGIGMLVDNAVVVIENTYRHLEEGKNRIEAAIIGASEVGLAITASTFTTIVVFIPMSLTTGIASRLARPIAAAVSVSLLSSLFVAITIVPMIASVLFHRKGNTLAKNGRGEETGENNERAISFFEKFKEIYKRILYLALTHRKTVIFLALIVFLSAIIYTSRLGMEFMPKQDIPLLMMKIEMPVGTNLEETNRLVSKIEDILLNEPETLYVSSFVGFSQTSKQDVAFGFGAADVNEAQIMVRIKEKKQRERTSTEIMESIRKKLPKIAGTRIDFIDIAGAMLGGGGRTNQGDVEIKIFGKDLVILKEIAEKIAKLCEKIEGLREIRISLQSGKPELRLVLDREKIASYGLTVSEIANTVQTAVLGKVATRFRVAGDEYDIRVRFPENQRKSLSAIYNLRVSSPFGVQVPLYQLAEIKSDFGPLEITRENQTRKVSVTANTYKRDIKSIIDDISNQIIAIGLPSGYFLEYGGAYERMRETFSSLIFAAFISIILIYMVMAAQFESLVHPLVIMFSVPLSLIGVIAGMALFREHISTPALLGTIILFGVAVNNGIVMIDYINQLRRRGMEAHQAIIEGAATRLRAILITSITTILGVFPMIFSRAEGAEMRRPLGIALGFGLMSSTFLTLFIIPVVYSIFDRISYKIQKKAKEILYNETS